MGLVDSTIELAHLASTLGILRSFEAALCKLTNCCTMEVPRSVCMGGAPPLLGDVRPTVVCRSGEFLDILRTWEGRPICYLMVVCCIGGPSGKASPGASGGTDLCSVFRHASIYATFAYVVTLVELVHLLPVLPSFLESPSFFTILCSYSFWTCLMLVGGHCRDSASVLLRHLHSVGFVLIGGLPNQILDDVSIHLFYYSPLMFVPLS